MKSLHDSFTFSHFSSWSISCSNLQNCCEFGLWLMRSYSYINRIKLIFQNLNFAAFEFHGNKTFTWIVLPTKIFLARYLYYYWFSPAIDILTTEVIPRLFFNTSVFVLKLVTLERGEAKYTDVKKLEMNERRKRRQKDCHKKGFYFPFDKTIRMPAKCLFWETKIICFVSWPYFSTVFSYYPWTMLFSKPSVQSYNVCVPSLSYQIPNGKNWKQNWQGNYQNCLTPNRMKTHPLLNWVFNRVIQGVFHFPRTDSFCVILGVFNRKNSENHGSFISDPPPLYR